MRMTFSIVLILSATASLRAADIDPDKLRRGLVASYSSSSRSPEKLMRIDPVVAISLKANEAAHPQLAPAGGGGTVTWIGYVNITRAGNYRFHVLVRGLFKLMIDKDRVQTAVTGDTPAVKELTAMRLEAGVHSFVAYYDWNDGPARAELMWEGPQFRREPLPFDVLGHLPEETERFKSDALAERGRYLAEEFACFRCHSPGDNKVAKGLTSRMGPDLTKVGSRVQASWIYAWLESPRKLRPATTMPDLFKDDDNGKVERYAVTRYLASLGGPVPEKPKPKDVDAIAKRGDQLFASVGCAACHNPTAAAKKRGDDDETPRPPVLHAAPSVYPLSDLGSKTTPEALVAYLMNPLAISPSGRMPHMLLSQNEARDLATMLCQTKSEAVKDLPPAPLDELRLATLDALKLKKDEQAAIVKMPADRQWVELGRHLTIQKGCVSCHTIAPDGKALEAVTAAPAEKLKGAKGTGCLATDAAKRGKAPLYRDVEGLKAIQEFLAHGLEGAGSPAPAHAAEVTMQRFNCLACHGRDGEGGLSSSLVELLRKNEKAENAEAVVPPPLTGVAHKLRTPWIREVLTKQGRARPWMGLRMPQFGEANINHLPEALAALEGTDANDAIHKVALSDQKVQAGRLLVGKPGFGCISCHDIAGIPNFGTRGPDMVTMNQRVRYEWYERWLEQAQRMQPGTRMPTIFTDGKSQLEKVLNGSPAAQAEAMWAYLSLGPTLPLPQGLELPKGMTLAVHEKPVILRTFMPEAGARAIAVGYPSGVSVVFDALNCRLAYAWSGNFLDVSPVWANRGGSPAKLLGPKFWTSPPGCSWALTDNSAPPDFAARLKDPRFNGPLPEGTVHNGPRLLRFLGYTVDGGGIPTFKYEVDASPTQTLVVEEMAEPARSAGGVGVRRHFQMNVPGNQTAWMLAGESDAMPRVLDAKGELVKFDLQGDFADFPAAGRAIVLSQGSKPTVLALSEGPAESAWHLQKTGTKWSAILRLPLKKQAFDMRVNLGVWSPYRDEPAVLKELLTAK